MLPGSPAPATVARMEVHEDDRSAVTDAGEPEDK
jgi:hypothetical protein